MSGAKAPLFHGTFCPFFPAFSAALLAPILLTPTTSSPLAWRFICNHKPQQEGPLHVCIQHRQQCAAKHRQLSGAAATKGAATISISGRAVPIRRPFYRADQRRIARNAAIELVGDIAQRSAHKRTKWTRTLPPPSPSHGPRRRRYSAPGPRSAHVIEQPILGAAGLRHSGTRLDRERPKRLAIFHPLADILTDEVLAHTAASS